MVAAAVGAATLVAGVYSANQQSNAAQDAAGQQSASAQAGIAETQRQFDAVRQLLNPYVQAGTGALGAQQDLLGIGAGGQTAQKAAIDALMASPQFTSAQQLGENRVLANASATGNLRGGNTQAALAQFSPALLASTINDQYARLGGLTSIGQNAAAGVGNAGMQTGSQVASLLQQQGAALAGGALADGRAAAGYSNAVGNAFGAYGALGGFRRPAANVGQANNGYGGYGDVQYGDGYGPF